MAPQVACEKRKFNGNLVSLKAARARSFLRPFLTRQFLSSVLQRVTRRQRWNLLLGCFSQSNKISLRLVNFFKKMAALVHNNFSCHQIYIYSIKNKFLHFPSQIIEFSGNKSAHVIAIKLLFDAHRKIRSAFSVHLSSDMTGESSLGLKKVIVYIEQPSTNPTVTFPLSPRIVSLRDYDDVSGAGSEVIMGYPLICVTVSFQKNHKKSKRLVCSRILSVVNVVCMYVAGVVFHFCP